MKLIEHQQEANLFTTFIEENHTNGPIEVSVPVSNTAHTVGVIIRCRSLTLDLFSCFSYTPHLNCYC
jgi:hypothetical protein